MKEPAAEIRFRKETPYGLLEVRENKEIRWLVVDGRMESAIYTDARRDHKLVFPYMQRFSYAFAVNPAIQKTLLIGGGAFSYPRYYLSAYPEKTIDVAEISPEILQADRTYFDLDQLLSPRLHIYQKDGFQYLFESSEKYDLIINDAFIGQQQKGRDQESCRIVKEHLQNDGIYLINAAVAPKGIYSHRYHAFSTLLKQEFPYTAVIQCEPDRSIHEKQNILFAASKEPLL